MLTSANQRSPQPASRIISMPPAPLRVAPAAGSAELSFGKRAFDLVVALVLTVAVLPILLLVALAVKLTSRGPVMFKQGRVGHGGRNFTIRKFRTMQADAEEALAVEPRLLEIYVDQDHKIPAGLDPRVTRLGRWLRKTSLDELPQLLNVVQGDMSLVGPRPVRPSELPCYGDLLPAYLSVRPGLTGLWQVSGRSEVKFPRRAELDADYSLRRCPRLDLAILMATPGAVLRGRGAQ